MLNVRSVQAALVGAGYAVAIDGQLGPKTYAALFAHVGGGPITPLRMALGAAASRWFGDADLDTGRRIAHALAQWAVETGGFVRMEEQLVYSAKRLMEVWPKRFPTEAKAQLYAGNAVKLANQTYGYRLGNTGPNDGWTFRGRGPTQLTGRWNYQDAKALTGVDVVADPDAVAEPDTGLRVACAYWAKRAINVAADRDDVADVRYRVNGGRIGLEDAQRYLARAKIVLN